MVPQHRGVIPAEHADRIRQALAGKEAADAELVASGVAALKAGGSVREVAALTGMSTNTIQRWGREGGWPTEEQKAARKRDVAAKPFPWERDQG